MKRSLEIISNLFSLSTCIWKRYSGSDHKESASNAEDLGSIPGSESPWRRKWQPTQYSIAWSIPWTEEPGRLQSKGSQRVRHDWATNTFFQWRQSVRCEGQLRGPGQQVIIVMLGKCRPHDLMHLFCGSYHLIKSSILELAFSWISQPGVWTVSCQDLSYCFLEKISLLDILKIEVHLIYDVVLVSGAQQNGSYTHVCMCV